MILNKAHGLQDDLLYENLTVRETLYYAAMLKLPRSMSVKEKTRRVDLTIKALGIEDCQHTIVGENPSKPSSVLTFEAASTSSTALPWAIGHKLPENDM